MILSRELNPALPPPGVNRVRFEFPPHFRILYGHFIGHPFSHLFLRDLAGSGVLKDER